MLPDRLTKGHHQSIVIKRAISQKERSSSEKENSLGKRTENENKDSLMGGGGFDGIPTHKRYHQSIVIKRAISQEGTIIIKKKTLWEKRTGNENKDSLMEGWRWFR
ncbi:hypothetical protein CEXT_431031 [Caerostris extrusa]|uniref:Uncharacterized protein n=1 Tax=Caerostris extrusa TaxID=172846 RepID=A0AAV4WZ86_CAEEX|nr:hypothetical protein CEXT_431031 [Caerostris extrusa]